MLVVGLIIVDWNYHGENIALIYSPAAQHYVQRGFYILLFLFMLLILQQSPIRWMFYSILQTLHLAFTYRSDVSFWK